MMLGSGELHMFMHFDGGVCKSISRPSLEYPVEPWSAPNSNIHALHNTDTKTCHSNSSLILIA